jgi:UPF0755 protein
MVLTGEQASVFIKPGDNIDDVTKYLKDSRIMENTMSFRVVTRFLEYNNNVKPGHYVFTKKMNNIEAVRLLRSGAQTPMKVTFNSARTRKDLVEKITPYLIADPKEFLTKLNDNAYLKQYGFDSLTITAMFIPNTYEMFWTTDVDGVFKRMKREYDRYWNDERKQKAAALSLTPLQVATLASIVQGETQMNDEKPRVAGVYLNRLKKGMKLQADPTVIFALQDFTIKRVLLKHLETDSPYNTYKYEGLPPGPINVPDPTSLNAVLNYEQHSYIFFCAKEDFSGYHNFAETAAQHGKNAEKYRQALNKKGIF